MLAYLDAVVAACTVNQKAVVDVDRNMMDLHPALTRAGTATVVIRTITGATACVLAGEKDKIASLELARIGKQNPHALAFFRHACRGQAIHRI